MATFTFHGAESAWDGVWRALERVTAPHALLEMAVARLRAETPNVELDGTRIVVNEDEPEDIEARTRELVRVLSAEPYLVDGKYTFLPYFSGRPYSSALRWGGSLASSRLEQYSGPTTFGGHVQFRRDGHEISVEPIRNDPDAVAFLGGVRIARAMRLSMPQLLLLTRRSSPMDEQHLVLFPNPPDVIFFASSLLLSAVTMQDPWTLTALEAAKLRGNRFSLMLIDKAAGERRDAVAALPSNVRRTVGYLADVLAIAAEGAEDDLVVHGDQMREYFASPHVTVAYAIARPKETPQALFERVRAMLGR